MTRETSLALVLDHLDSARAEVDDGYLSGALPLEVAGALDRAVGVAQDVVRAVQSSAGGGRSPANHQRLRSGAERRTPQRPGVPPTNAPPVGDSELTLVLPRDAA